MMTYRDYYKAMRRACPRMHRGFAYAQYRLYAQGCRDARMHDATLVILSVGE